MSDCVSDWLVMVKYTVHHSTVCEKVVIYNHFLHYEL